MTEDQTPWDGVPTRGAEVSIPVDLGLLEEVPESASAEAYPAPTPQEVADVERETAERIATVRDEQSLNIANMGTDGAAHFLVNVEGRELCGSCGTPFPCEKWSGEIEPRNTAESSGQPVADEDKARSVAELLGVSLERARQIVLLSTPLDQL